MIAVEAGRRAARPVRRYERRPQQLSLLCMRCDKRFRCPTITRECHLCQLASERLYGTAHPAMEMSGL